MNLMFNALCSTSIVSSFFLSSIPHLRKGRISVQCSSVLGRFHSMYIKIDTKFCPPPPSNTGLFHDLFRFLAVEQHSLLTSSDVSATFKDCVNQTINVCTIHLHLWLSPRRVLSCGWKRQPLDMEDKLCCGYLLSSKVRSLEDEEELELQFGALLTL